MRKRQHLRNTLIQRVGRHRGIDIRQEMHALGKVDQSLLFIVRLQYISSYLVAQREQSAIEVYN